ncbi:MAG: hypothetical protein Q9188_004690 [Gyalolechia gomerana]
MAPTNSGTKRARRLHPSFTASGADRLEDSSIAQDKDANVGPKKKKKKRAKKRKRSSSLTSSQKANDVHTAESWTGPTASETGSGLLGVLSEGPGSSINCEMGPNITFERLIPGADDPTKNLNRDGSQSSFEESFKGIFPLEYADYDYLWDDSLPQEDRVLRCAGFWKAQTLLDIFLLVG